MEPAYPKLNKIENEIQDLKTLILRALEISEGAKQVVSLGGALKGIKIEENDFEEAKKSLFQT